MSTEKSTLNTLDATTALDAAARQKKPILVIDASYGLTIAVVGHKPCHIADSHAHVEQLVPTVKQALSSAGLHPHDLGTVVAASGPGPFTGLRVGIVAARALAFATGARLLGHDVLSPQAAWEQAHPHARIDRLVLAVNDARRKQLYWQLWRICRDGKASALSAMDISYPATIAQRVNQAEKDLVGWRGSVTRPVGMRRGQSGDPAPLPLIIVGPGTSRYRSTWDGLAREGLPVLARINDSVLCADGEEGPRLFAGLALQAEQEGGDVSTEPLYLRRPDAQVPPTPKPALENEVREGQAAKGDVGVPASRRSQAPESAREATREGRNLKWSSWSKADLKKFATQTDPNVDDEDEPDELATFGSDSDAKGSR